MITFHYKALGILYFYINNFGWVKLERIYFKLLS